MEGGTNVAKIEMRLLSVNKPAHKRDREKRTRVHTKAHPLSLSLAIIAWHSTAIHRWKLTMNYWRLFLTSQKAQSKFKSDFFFPLLLSAINLFLVVYFIRSLHSFAVQSNQLQQQRCRIQRRIPATRRIIGQWMKIGCWISWRMTINQRPKSKSM